MPTILTKKSDTPGSVPATADLTNAAGGAELAVNTADKRLFALNSSSAVVEIGTNPGSLTTADASATVFRSGSATITNLIATTGTVSDLSATVARVGSGTVTTLVSTSATITNLTATSATIDNFTFTSATVTRLAATSATISDLSATVGRIESGTITNLLATSLTVSSGTTLNGGVVINELGADADTRIEGDTDANLFFVDASADNVGIGTSSPVGKLTIAYPAGANAPTTVTAANTYLQLGSAEFGASNNGKFMIGFGYTDALVNTNSPAYIGYEEVSTSGDTFGNLTFYTRSVTTDTAPDKRMTIDSSGNLGLGVTPSAGGASGYKLFEIGNAGGGSIYAGPEQTLLSTNVGWDVGTAKYKASSLRAMQYSQESGQHIWKTAASGTAGDPITFTQAMTLTAAGDLAVGQTTSVPYSGNPGSTNFTLSGTSNPTTARPSITLKNSDDSTRAWWVIDANSGAFIGTYTNNFFGFQTNNTERARITADGNLLVGTTDGGATSGVGVKFNSSATIPGTFTVFNTAGGGNTYHLYNTNATNNGYRFYVQVDGGISNFSGNNNNLSDERVKKDISLAPSYWNIIKDIEIVTFKYKDQDHDDVNVGVIAQQIEKVNPVWVNTDGFGETPEDGVPLKTVYTTDMYHAAIKALQEAMTRIEELEAKVAALEAK